MSVILRAEGLSRFFGGLAAVLEYHRLGAVRWRLVAPLVGGFLLGVGVGSLAANAIPERPLQLGFVGFLLVSAARTGRSEGGGDIGYLRIAGEGALPLSHFDIGGEVTERGVKGVLYGERGVWRPGDTLHLTFALFDRGKVLPADHPVVLELSNPQGQLVLTAKPEKVVAPFYAFRVATDETAPTGNWQARVLVGGLTFSKALKIETVVPNRLKIVLDAGRDVLVRKDMPFDAAVTALEMASLASKI